MYEYARDDPHRIIVVCAPGNVEMITQVLDNVGLPSTVSLLYVVQPKAAGPVAALWLGLQAGLKEPPDEPAMMLCGDNYIPDETWEKAQKIFYENAHQNALFFGNKKCATLEASRMTVLTESGRFHNGLSVQPSEKHRLHDCWVGPVMFTGLMRKDIENCAPHSKTFADLFNEAIDTSKQANKMTSRYAFTSDTKDIGVPEALL